LDARDRHQQNAYDLVRKSFYRTALILTHGIDNKVTQHAHRIALRQVWDRHGKCEKPLVGAQTIRLQQVFVINEQLELAARTLGLAIGVEGPAHPIKASKDFVWGGQDPRYAPGAIRAADFERQDQKYR
jgi:hypothetical protein